MHTVPCIIQPPPPPPRNPHLLKCKSLSVKFTRLPSDYRISAMTRGIRQTLPTARGTLSTQPMMLPRQRDSWLSVLSRRRKENAETHNPSNLVPRGWLRMKQLHDVDVCSGRFMIVKCLYCSPLVGDVICCHFIQRVYGIWSKWPHPQMLIRG